MHCFGYSKKSWRTLMEHFPEFNRQLSIIIFSLYDKQIRKPMIEKKFSHLRGIAERNDYDQILVL